jgi:hypothetical protein
MTGPAAPKTLPTKNPPAQPSGFEILISALAVFLSARKLNIKSALRHNYSKFLLKLTSFSYLNFLPGTQDNKAWLIWLSLPSGETDLAL